MKLSASFNMKSFESDIKNTIRSVERNTTAVVSNVANQGLGYAKSNVPVRTGFLRSSIILRMTSKYSATIISQAEYSSYIEYGSFNRTGYYFMYHTEEYITNLLVNEMKSMLSKTVKIGRVR